MVFSILDLSDVLDGEGLVLVETAVSVALAVLIIKFIFGTSVWGSFKAWLPTLIAPCVAVALAVLIKLCLFQSFAATTNLMAPTLVGDHWLSKCVQCGQPNYCSPMLNWDRSLPERLRPKLICENFHVTQSADISRKQRSPDRFLVAKFLKPNRWDVVAFRLPENPDVVLSSRVVGLPGETVHIDDGDVWINSVRQVPPESLTGIEYLAEPVPYSVTEPWTKDKKAVLGEDELFVLSDNSAMSFDSRSWQQGAPDHNSFAVPQENVVGVLTHTFWPPGRWRIHR